MASGNSREKQSVLQRRLRFIINLYNGNRRFSASRVLQHLDRVLTEEATDAVSGQQKQLEKVLRQEDLAAALGKILGPTEDIAISNYWIHSPEIIKTSAPLLRDSSSLPTLMTFPPRHYVPEGWLSCSLDIHISQRSSESAIGTR